MQSRSASFVGTGKVARARFVEVGDVSIARMVCIRH